MSVKGALLRPDSAWLIHKDSNGSASVLSSCVDFEASDSARLARSPYLSRSVLMHPRTRRKTVPHCDARVKAMRSVRMVLVRVLTEAASVMIEAAIREAVLGTRLPAAMIALLIRKYSFFTAWG